VVSEVLAKAVEISRRNAVTPRVRNISARCPIHGCDRTKLPMQVMCYNHWRQVPYQLQLKVWRRYREARGSAAHLEACVEAIKAVS
jgi:hypothetical protein